MSARLKTNLAKRVLGNAILAAAVFLPAFLVMAEVEVLLFTGFSNNSDILLGVSAAIYTYLLLVLPVLLASLVYSLVSIIIPNLLDFNAAAFGGYYTCFALTGDYSLITSSR